MWQHVSPHTTNAVTKRTTMLTLVTASVALLSPAAHAQGECNGQWSPLGSGVSGGIVRAATTFDDGNGSALFTAGNFTTADGQTASRIARWDGQAWSAVAGTFNGTINAMAVYDDGNGPALFVGGSFSIADNMSINRLARWDGSTWSAVGSGFSGGIFPTVNTLAVHDDGSGLALFIGGGFTSANGVNASSIVRYNGSQWTALGSGISGGPFGGYVSSMAVFNDGNGAALYVGGEFDTAGGNSASNIARWNGAAWSALGSGISGGFEAVFAMTTFNAGSGQALYVGGMFLQAGGQNASRIARWNGSQWSSIGGGVGNNDNASRVYALTVFDDGSGQALYAGGEFETAGGQNASSIARWNGVQWTALQDGVSGDVTSLPRPSVFALTVYNDALGPALFAGGDFSQAGEEIVNSTAKWQCNLLGACCVNGLAILTLANDCVALGGVYQGPGTSPDRVNCEPPVPSCAADLNGDGVVNVSDLLQLLGAWGTCP
jgi:hypothetical protein